VFLVADCSTEVACGGSCGERAGKAEHIAAGKDPTPKTALGGSNFEQQGGDVSMLISRANLLDAMTCRPTDTYPYKFVRALTRVLPTPCVHAFASRRNSPGSISVALFQPAVCSQSSNPE